MKKLNRLLLLSITAGLLFNSPLGICVDTTVDANLFAEVRDAAVNSEILSSEITLTNINNKTPITIEGGSYSVNGGNFSSTEGLLNKGDKVTLRLKTSGEEKGLSLATATIGEKAYSFKVINAGRKFGINFNEQLAVLSDAAVNVNIPELNPEWVRGFFDFYSMFDKDTLEPTDEFEHSKNIARFIQLKQKGYKTVLNIKWNYKAKHNPTEMPSSPEALQKHRAALKAIYEKVWPYVDLMVVGNEPFIESPGEKVPSVDSHIVAFYKAMLDETIKFRAASGRKDTPLYLGAFNRLENEKFQKASDGLFALAKATPEVAGVDLHVHHMDNNFGEMKISIDYALNRIRKDQRFISTEFSAMRYWKTKTPLPLSDVFIAKYKLPKNMKVHEYLNKVLMTKPTSGAVDREQWLDFVDMHDWYTELQKNYLAQAYKTFTASPQFLLATYGFRQAFGGKFDETKDPWILNAIFANQSIKLRNDGSYNLNKYYHLDFDRLR